MPPKCPHLTQAKLEGRTTYNTGRPCKNGHHSDRFVANRQCIECQRARVIETKPWRGVTRDRAEYSREYYQSHPGYYTERDSKRKNSIKQASVYTRRGEINIRRIKLASRILNLCSDELYEVDHIVPLQHPEVCGLHVAANLQIIPKQENRMKSNSFDREYVERLMRKPPDVYVNAIFAMSKAIKNLQVKKKPRVGRG